VQVDPRSPRPRRRHRALMAFVAVSVTAVALTGTGLPAQADGPTDAVAPTTDIARPGGDLRTITYAGLSVTVPASWPVIDLAKTPRACVRVDRHAVYLGTPAPDQDCPARIMGHTEALLLAPAAALKGTQAGLGATATAVGTAPALTAQARQLGQFAQTFTAARVTALASFGENPETVRAVLASITKVSNLTPRYAAPAPAPAQAELTDKIDYGNATTGTNYKGLGFDTCQSPSTGAMNAWRASPFRSIGIYIGGRNRACLWGNLSPTWVRATARMGWRLQPIYVGLQPACTNQRGMADISLNRTEARAQGRAEGADAVSRAKALGLYRGSALYSDIESYNNYAKVCVASTMAYLDGFVRALHDRGYLAGVYSSAYSAILNLAQRYGTASQARPDVVWTARWDGVATTSEKVLSPSKWAYQARAKQYRGDHTSRYGGVSIRIDSNYLNAMVASVTYDYRVQRMLHVWTAPTTASRVVRTVAVGSTVRILCQVRGMRISGDNVWNKLTDGRWISDKRVTTASAYGYSSPVPKCTWVYQTWRTRMTLYAGPTSAARVVGTRPYGSLTHTVCQKRGSWRGGSRVWNKLQYSEWIHDYDVRSGHASYNPLIPRCQ